MDRLRFKCRERGGPITLIGEIHDYQNGVTKSAKLLTFSPTTAADIVFDIDAIDATILGKLHGGVSEPTPVEPEEPEPEEQDYGHRPGI